MVYPGDNVFFNSTQINTINNFLVKAVDVHEMPKRALEAYKLARVNGEALVSGFYDYREIVIYCTIVAPNKSTFEQVRDTLMATFSPLNGVLSLPIAGASRQYTCSLSDNTNWPDFGSGYASMGGLANFEIHLNAYDPFGYDATSTAITLGTVTSSPTTYNATFGGTFDARPVFTLTVSSVTATGAQSLIITNPSTGLAVTINRAWTAADVVVIDIKNRTVTVNGVVTAWSGSLPTWTVGAGSIQISDTFTARSIVATCSYVKRYL